MLETPIVFDGNSCLMHKPPRPTISIVTPNYNTADFISTTIESVLTQNYENLEYVVIDGASTDGSQDVIERYLPRLTKYVSEPDNGHADAINKGFALTSGEIMGWINSDDMLLPGCLETVASIFAEHPEIEWITGRPTAFNDSLKDLKVHPLKKWSRLRFLCGDYRWVQQESTFWRRSLWDRAGSSLSQDLKLAVDFELWLRFFRHAELRTANVALGSFRYRAGQRSKVFIDQYEAEASQLIAQEFESVSQQYKAKHPSILPDQFVKLSISEVEELDQQLSAEDPEPLFTKTHANDLSRFRGIHKGERCFIMGNGPSLNKTNLELLSSETVFACNGAFLLFNRINWRPKYYTCVDSRVLPDRAVDIERMLLRDPDILAFFPCELIEHGTSELRRFNTREIICPGTNRFFFNEKQNSLENLPHSMFSGDINKVVVQPYTVAITMMQIAAYMGFSEIYLIGCDTSYSISQTVERDGRVALTSTDDNDENHFDPTYFGKNRKWHDPQVDKMIEHHAHAKTFLDSIGVKVFNATVGGNLEVFPRVQLETLFQPARHSSPAKSGSGHPPQALRSVVVPMIASELPKALANLQKWDSDELNPGHIGDGIGKPWLVYSLNCGPNPEIENTIKSAFSNARRVRCAFEGVRIQFCDLPPEKDIYIRGKSAVAPTYGLKSGPNWLFYESISRLRELGGFAFLMETDCHPVQSNWLSALDDVARRNSDAWIVGSHYRGRGRLAADYARHLNGNALYQVGSKAFWTFVDKTLWPFLEEQVKGPIPWLAYDCAWEAFVRRPELEDQNHPDWLVIRETSHRLRGSDVIMNLAGGCELAGLHLRTREELLSEHPECFLVHGPLREPAPAVISQPSADIIPKPAPETSAASPKKNVDRRCIVLIDPDAVSEFGHYIHFIDRFRDAATCEDANVIVFGSKDAAESIVAPRSAYFRRVFSLKSWDLGLAARDKVESNIASFANDLERALASLASAQPIELFMYLGSVEAAEAVRRVVGKNDKIKSWVNLFYSSFPDRVARTQEYAAPILHAIAKEKRVHLTATTERLADRLQVTFGNSFAVLPHPSTTFSDAEVKQLLGNRPTRSANAKLRVLFPGGLLPEKGISKTIAIAAMLARQASVDVIIRNHVRPNTDKLFLREIEALKGKVHLIEGELSTAAYKSMIQECDIVVVPYEASHFGDRTSGAFIDAVFAGKVTVCDADTWMGRIINDNGIGETVRTSDPKEYVEKIEKISGNIAKYDNSIATFRNAYARDNSWSALIRSLVEFNPAAASSKANAGLFQAAPQSRKSSLPLILLGNGPSLRGFDFAQLKGFATIGLNAAYRHWDQIGFRPTYYACLDAEAGLSHKDAIARLIREPNGPERFLLRDNLIRTLGVSSDSPQIYNFDWLRDWFDLLQGDPVTTGSHAALWAALMGYRDIVLMGVDASYQDQIPGGRARNGIVREIVASGPNPNYYFDAYQQVGDQYHQPDSQPNLHLNAWRMVRDVLTRRGVRIWNASPTSKLDVFERRAFASFRLKADQAT